MPYFFYRWNTIIFAINTNVGIPASPVYLDNKITITYATWIVLVIVVSKLRDFRPQLRIITLQLNHEVYICIPVSILLFCSHRPFGRGGVGQIMTNVNVDGFLLMANIPLLLADPKQMEITSAKIQYSSKCYMLGI